MQLKKLAAKPQLIKIELTNKDVVEKYGEPVEFYTWDRQPMDVFMRLATASENGAKSKDMFEMTKDLIMDEKGKPILEGDNVLPTDLLIIAISSIVERLGKL